MSMDTLAGQAVGRPSSGELIRAIDWRGAFWVASGVPALVLFSIGGIAGTAGKVAFLDLDRVDDHGLHPVLHLRRDRRAVSEQVGRRVGLWRGCLGALLQDHRAAVGVVQLGGVDAGAVARLLHRRRLHPQCSRADPGGRCSAGRSNGSRRTPEPSRRTRRASPSGSPPTPARRRSDARRGAHVPGRHRGLHAAFPHLDAVLAFAGAGLASRSTRRSSSARC